MARACPHLQLEEMESKDTIVAEAQDVLTILIPQNGALAPLVGCHEWHRKTFRAMGSHHDNVSVRGKRPETLRARPDSGRCCGFSGNANGRVTVSEFYGDGNDNVASEWHTEKVMYKLFGPGFFFQPATQA